VDEQYVGKKYGFPKKKKEKGKRSADLQKNATTRGEGKKKSREGARHSATPARKGARNVIAAKEERFTSSDGGKDPQFPIKT